MPLTPQEQVLLSWRRDPVLFVRQALGVEEIEVWQVEALNRINLHDRLAVRSGHGVGKSALLAWIILWWILTRYPAKAACTANTSTQLHDVLWGELDLWYRKLPEGMKDLLELKADYLVLKEDPKQSFAVARTARKEQPEAFQGYHSPNMLFIADEASGVDDIIFEVGRGAMSSRGAKTVITGNPTRTSGYFYNAFHSMKAFWQTMHVPCASSSRVSEQYIEECKEEYGQESNAYRVRVLGEFPVEGDDTVIPLHLCESAVDRDVGLIPDSGEVWGLDVARFGDDRTALAKRASNHLVEPIKWWRGKDTMQVCGAVIDEYNLAKRKPTTIFVDTIGIGSGVYDRLAELGYPVAGINVSESPAFGDRFLRLRDELWWNTREWFRGLNVRIPDDGALIAELTLPTYTHSSSGKVKVESKDEIKKRTAKTASSMGKSPDLADALVLTMCHGSLVTRKQKKLNYPKQDYV
jgi:phage terminase large subunit